MKNQKIGIVTWFNYPNPGTAFQAYALQQFICSIPQCRAEIINMLGNSTKDAIKAPVIRPYARQYGSFYKIVRVILGIKSYLFCSFQRKYIIKWPAKPLNPKDYSLVNDRYDQIILGGDQLWNLDINKKFDFDKKGQMYFRALGKSYKFVPKSQFLGFVEGPRKGAYGPSTGNDVWPDEYKGEIKDLLSDFSFIGVREKQAVSMVQSLVDVPVHWSLDPTFLLDKTAWAKIARKPKEKKDYIFEYCIIKSPSLRAVTEKLSEMTGLPVIESHIDLRKHVPSARRMPHPSADTWLGYMMNARYIVTDSFHGCAFSINTNKDFYTVTTLNESRIYSLLELFGLQNRMLKQCDELKMPESIDWNSVNVRLEDRRKESQDWLKSSLLEE